MLTVSEIITKVGCEYYGNKFSLDIEGRREIYKETYENIYNSLSGSGKGVGLIGNVGFGKTACLKIMQKLFTDTNRRFKFVSASAVMDMVVNGDELDAIKEECLCGEVKGDIMIDDIGLGAAVFKNYGNDVNIIGKILLYRYELFVNQGILTHFTSNKYIDLTDAQKILNPNYVSLTNLYGDRVIDRLKEMSNIIVCKGKSLRS